MYDQHIIDLKGYTGKYWFNLHCHIMRMRADDLFINWAQQNLPPVVLNLDTRPWKAYYL